VELVWRVGSSPASSLAGGLLSQDITPSSYKFVELSDAPSFVVPSTALSVAQTVPTAVQADASIVKGPLGKLAAHAAFSSSRAASSRPRT